MRRHRKDLRPLTEINLTSLLDVAFVLLIAFMIVAPSIKFGIDLSLPTMKEGAPQLGQNEQSLYTIVVPKPANSSQEYYMNDTPAQLTDIENRLRMQKKTNPNVAVEIQADKEVPYQTFIEVVGAVRRAGVESVGLPVDTASIKPVEVKDSKITKP